MFDVFGQNVMAKKIKGLVSYNYELVKTILCGQNSIEFVNFELKKKSKTTYYHGFSK
jgi:hypothetical protein